LWQRDFAQKKDRDQMSDVEDNSGIKDNAEMSLGIGYWMKGYVADWEKTVECPKLTP
jgi:hypothetical protein